MKRKTTKEILASSFREVADSKPVDKITVRDITENCGYSPATFYRHFRDKYDLIAWVYTRSVEKIMDTIDKENSTWNQSLLAGANLFIKERKYLINLLLNTSGLDSFSRNMTEVSYNALRKFIEERYGKETIDDKIDMCIRVYCLGTIHLTCEWILGMYDFTPEELAEIYEDSLPALLRPLLLN